MISIVYDVPGKIVERERIRRSREQFQLNLEVDFPLLNVSSPHSIGEENEGRHVFICLFLVRRTNYALVQVYGKEITGI